MRRFTAGLAALLGIVGFAGAALACGGMAESGKQQVVVLDTKLPHTPAPSSAGR